MIEKAIYKILVSPKLEELEAQINEALASGWRLQGGASFGAAKYMQALVLEDISEHSAMPAPKHL